MIEACVLDASIGRRQDMSKKRLYRCDTRHFNWATYDEKIQHAERILSIPTQKEEMLLKPEKGPGNLFIRKQIIILWKNIYTWISVSS
jgi:hypothetical protein